MNHLAHFALSGDDEDIIMGNFIADFISNKELPQYTEGVQRGIHIHREIDNFTDNHPFVKQSTKRLHPFHHKYSPVIVDIYYDFLLGKNWQLYYPPSVSLPDFTKKMYTIVKKRQVELPESLQKRIGSMIKNNWLMAYTQLDGLRFTFDKIEKQAAFPGNFGNAVHHLELFLDDFDKEFRAFFPQLKEHIAKEML